MSDGTNTYLYGNSRISEYAGVDWTYCLADALGSVRQLTDSYAFVLFAQSYDPYGTPLNTYGETGSNYGYTGEWTDGTGLQHLRARYLDTGIGRFISRDTWEGDYNDPLSLNRWNYVEGNPINFTDPSGYCVFTGVDTLVCLIALAIGIPIISGVSTASWNYSVTQGGGVGGRNFRNPECIDWAEVYSAGKSGFFGAVDSEASTVASIPLAPVYLMAGLAYEKSPTEVNINILSNFGLDDDYRALLNNPNYAAGRAGGGAATSYISLATFVKNLPSIAWKTGYRIGGLSGGAAELVLTVEGISLVGGNGALIYVGAAGMPPSFLLAKGAGKGGGKMSYNQMNQQILRGQAPRGIKRIDFANLGPFEKVHVTFENDAALYVNGTWKHGFYFITNKQKEWLILGGWKIP
ncbi:MAG: RHS repeat-associated core domain-containing protein [Anaerolineales bacterium]